MNEVNKLKALTIPREELYEEYVVKHIEKFMEVVNPVIKNEPWKEN